ncbi:MAG TPA: M1 family metallopeptidase, partial [Mycobacterium sp.]|nr:M1 family metallopeptidase [Mycobacterium sp.]
MRSRIGSFLAATAIAVPLLSAFAAPGGEARYAFGSAGVGDSLFPNAGNGGYDVDHYDLDLAYDPASDRLHGVVEIHATATADLSRFDLDFRGLQISRLLVNGLPSDYRRDGQELVITPRPKLKAGKSFVVLVEYAGVPEVIINDVGGMNGWIPTDDGAFVANEPQGAPGWFPSNDTPRDKATIDIAVTVPDGLVAMSNGTLASHVSAGGFTTWRWHEPEPIATYLVTATVGVFDLSETTLADGTLVMLAFDPAHTDRAVFDRLPEMMEFMTDRFGPYPFGSVGAIVDNAPDIGYALETQTKPLFSILPRESVIAHELTHQWFGDSVTPADWADIWLNEGFATFGDFLWREHTGGPTLAQSFQQFMAVPAAAPFWSQPPANPGSPARMFDNFAVYLRGAATLQALRAKVGDDVFFGILRDWAAEHRWGNVTTADFIA